MLSVRPAKISESPFLTGIENNLCKVGFLISPSIRSAFLPICANETAIFTLLIDLPLFAVGLVTTNIGQSSPFCEKRRLVRIEL